MATKPLTSEAIALAEKKMDMTLGMACTFFRQFMCLDAISVGNFSNLPSCPLQMILSRCLNLKQMLLSPRNKELR